jgi:ABC-type transporter Mla maintaining outer membrane lipid asymmetry permease subunit MlaE
MSEPGRWLSNLWGSVLQSLDDAALRFGRFWRTNPHDLARFGSRLARALPAARWSPLILSRDGAASQTVRTFARGLGPVLLLGITLGLGFGSVADRFGMLLRPLVDETFLLAMVRDGMPLILSLLLTARTGASVAARLGDDRQTPFGGGPASAPQLVRSSLPHLVAGPITAWLFYQIATALLLAGYQSGGDPGDLAGALADIGFPLHPDLALGGAVAEGGAKTALFGFVIAYVSSALGIAANERSYDRPKDRAIGLQDAVWESGVTSIIVCVLSVILWWNVQGGLP